MGKKLILATGFLALLSAFPSAARADSDAITFSYSVTSGTVATEVNQAGSPSLTGGPVGGAVTVKDTNTSLTLILPADSTGMIQSDNNISYSAGPVVLAASYAGSAATQVQVLSSFCGGDCVSGTYNMGTYTAANGDGGAFGGVFSVTDISPAILAFFGDSTEIASANGGDAFTTSGNTWTNGGTTSTALFGSGSITVQTTSPVPEPGTLCLLCTGFLGLAGMIRRKSALMR